MRGGKAMIPFRFRRSVNTIESKATAQQLLGPPIMRGPELGHFKGWPISGPLQPLSPTGLVLGLIASSSMKLAIA